MSRFFMPHVFQGGAHIVVAASVDKEFGEVQGSIECVG